MNYSKEVSKHLNELLEKNIESEKTYKEASEKAEDQGLQNFFIAHAKQRKYFAEELKNEINSMGSSVKEEKGDTNDIKEMLSKLKSAVFGKSDQAYLKDTIEQDREALKEYEEVLQHTSVYPSTHKILVKQRDAIQKSITDVDVAVESMTV